MSANNHLLYRGYVVDKGTGLYYLQSRYYDPNVGRFLNADNYPATGQGLLGNNMFSYCRNNPVVRKDSKGTTDEDVTEEEKKILYDLLDAYATISENGFTIDLETVSDEWNECFIAIGIDEAYSLMADYLCAKYEEVYDKEFLFTNECVANEIKYHADAYMWALGSSGYKRPFSTRIFSKKYISKHCNIINISTQDVNVVKQRVIFKYKSGIRDIYMYTEEDPYYNSNTNTPGWSKWWRDWFR